MTFSKKIKNIFVLYKKILIIYLIGIIAIIIAAITSLTYEPPKTDDLINDTTTASTSNNSIDFEYGRYNFFNMNQDGTIDLQYIDITQNSNITSYNIEVIDSTHLKYNDNIYTYDPDNTIISQAYVDVISEEDIQSAIEATKEHFSSKPYKITNISFVEDTAYYYEFVEDYSPGLKIVVKATLVGTISNNTDIQYVTLKRATTNDFWEFYSSASSDN